MKYKLFISDYDGTLGHAPENNIDKETLSSINKFIEKGGIFAVCSGRETTSIMRILRAQKMKGLVVSFQGARISDIESGKHLLNSGLNTQDAIKVIDAVKDYPLIPLVYADDDLFFQKRDIYVGTYEKAIMLKGREADVRSEVEKLKSGICKVCWLGEDEIVNKVAKEMNEVFLPQGIKFNSGAKNLLEAINSNCGKGQAVEFLAKHYNVPLSEVIAVGDSTNDIDLIGGNWHGVAVGDGREELKAVADEITVPYPEKPVKYLLEKYCLND